MLLPAGAPPTRPAGVRPAAADRCAAPAPIAPHPPCPPPLSFPQVRTTRAEIVDYFVNFLKLKPQGTVSQ